MNPFSLSVTKKNPITDQRKKTEWVKNKKKLRCHSLFLKEDEYDRGCALVQDEKKMSERALNLNQHYN